MKTSMNVVAGKKFMVINTEIPVAAYREGITNLSVVVDKETEAEFTMTVDMTKAVGAVSKFGVIANAKEDGCFAILIPVKEDNTVEDVKKAYGAAMVAANDGLAALKAQMEKEAAAIDGICEGLDDTEDTVEEDAE